MKIKTFRRTVEWTVIAILLGAAVFLFAPIPKKPLKSRPAAAQTEPPQSKRSLEQVTDFANSRLGPLIFDELPKGTYPLPEIQVRYDTLVRMIRERYGKEHLIDWRSVYFENRHRTVATWVDQGVPTVFIALPSVMDLHELEQQNGVSIADSMRSFLVDFMHELDHLAHGYVFTSDHKAPEEIVRARNEGLTWAETCEHTMRPLLEIHKQKLALRHVEMYRLWLSCKRSADAPMWMWRTWKPITKSRGGLLDSRAGLFAQDGFFSGILFAWQSLKTWTHRSSKRCGRRIPFGSMPCAA